MHIRLNVHLFYVKASQKDAYALFICIFFRENLSKKMHTQSSTLISGKNRHITHKKARDLNIPGFIYFCYKGLKR